MTETRQSYYGDDLTFHAVAGNDVVFKGTDRAYIFVPKDDVVAAFRNSTDKSKAFSDAVAAIEGNNVKNTSPVCDGWDSPLARVA